MTETTTDTDTQTITEAVALIDRGLGDIAERSIVSTAEIADLLLDVRTLLTRVDVLSIQN